MNVKLKKKNLRSTNFELLNQIKGNSINNYFFKISNFCHGPYLDFFPHRKPNYATDVNTGPA
jgi:hypothetical protein